MYYSCAKLVHGCVCVRVCLWTERVREREREIERKRVRECVGGGGNGLQGIDQSGVSKMTEEERGTGARTDQGPVQLLNFKWDVTW